MAGRLPDAPGARFRVLQRDERGAAIVHGGVEIVPIARVYGVGAVTPWGTLGGSLTRPRSVEVRRGGVLHARHAVPDWGLRATLASAALVGLAALIHLRRRRSRRCAMT